MRTWLKKMGTVKKSSKLCAMHSEFISTRSPSSARIESRLRSYCYAMRQDAKKIMWYNLVQSTLEEKTQQVKKTKWKFICRFGKKVWNVLFFSFGCWIYFEVSVDMKWEQIELDREHCSYHITLAASNKQTSFLNNYSIGSEHWVWYCDPEANVTNQQSRGANN